MRRVTEPESLHREEVGLDGLDTITSETTVCFLFSTDSQRWVLSFPILNQVTVSSMMKVPLTSQIFLKVLVETLVGK